MSAARITSQIRIRPINGDFAFASVVVGGWSVSGIKISGDRIEWPTTEGKNGGRFAIVAPPPEIRADLEAEILDAYDNASGR